MVRALRPMWPRFARRGECLLLLTVLCGAPLVINLWLLPAAPPSSDPREAPPQRPVPEHLPAHVEEFLWREADPEVVVPRDPDADWRSIAEALELVAMVGAVLSVPPAQWGPKAMYPGASPSGLMAVLSVLAVLGQTIDAPLLFATILMVASSWVIKIIWWKLAGAAGSGSSLATATGLGDLGTVRSIMPPHSSENYLQHEMGFVVARKHAAQLRVLAILIGGIFPMAALSLLAAAPLVLIMALAAHMAGIFIERWLFFAEAKHSVTLYYGDAH